MVELVYEDIRAALLLSWLKYIPVTKKDVKDMDEKTENIEKLKREFLRINKNENPETPKLQLSKRVKNSSSGFMDSAMNSRLNSPGSSRFTQKNPEIHGAYGAGNRKRVRGSSSSMMNSGLSSVNGELMSKNPETHQASSGSGSRNSNQNPKRVRVLPPTLTNSPENSSGSLPKFPPIESLSTLIGECSKPFKKHLTKSDVDDHQGRLLLNSEDVRKRLLPLLNEESEDLAIGVDVKTYNPMGEFFNMTFKAWGNHKSYVLLKRWRDFINHHGLEEHDCVSIWMFRHNQTGELCFALTWTKKEEEEG